jgi:hypothetical protein
MVAEVVSMVTVMRQGLRADALIPNYRCIESEHFPTFRMAYYS